MAPETDVGMGSPQVSTEPERNGCRGPAMEVVLSGRHRGRLKAAGSIEPPGRAPECLFVEGFLSLLFIINVVLKTIWKI